MTAEALKRWLAAMKAAGLARTDADCARLLGIGPRQLWKWKMQGVTGSSGRRTSLACAALLAGITVAA